MKVSKFWCEDSTIINSRKNTILNCELSHSSIERIKESILYNCDSRVEMDFKNFVPVGNETEVGLLKFL